MYRLCVAILLFSLAGVARSEPAVAATYQVAVVDGINFTTDGMPKAANEREQFFKFFKEKMVAKGWTVISVVSEASCGAAEPHDCWPTLAKESPYVLRLTGQGNVKLGYTIHLELYSGATKRTSKNNTICETCFTDDIATFSAEIAQGLLRDAMTDDANAKRAAQEPPTQGTRRDIISTPAVSKRSQPSWLPWSMVGSVRSGSYSASLRLLRTEGLTVVFHPRHRPCRLASTTHRESLGILSLIGGGAWPSPAPLGSSGLLPTPLQSLFRLLTSPSA